MDLRNKITHRGFSPRDDSVAAALYIEVGLPFLSLCLTEFHDFDLDEGLLDEYAEQLRMARKTFDRTQHLERDKSYCFRGFVHLLRFNVKDGFSADWELDALVRADETGARFEREHEQRQKLESMFEVCWRFDCPVCGEPDAAVGELDSGSFEFPRLTAFGVYCPSCGLAVTKNDPFLADVLLERALEAHSDRIRQEYGG